MRWTNLFLLFILMSSVYGLSISGKSAKFEYNFEPGLTSQNSFMITNAEGYTSSYNIFPIHKKGADLTEYFTITPTHHTGVDSGQSVPFTVHMELPDDVDVPGVSETWIKVKIDNQDGVLIAYPSVVVRYLVYVLFPNKYIDWNFQAPNMDVNSTGEFTITVENLGEPTIVSSYADISIVSKETGQVVDTIRTQNERGIQSWDTRRLTAVFDTYGLRPGVYNATAQLNWDGNVSVITREFTVGSKSVKIINYTRLFERDAINKMDVEILSDWGVPISNLYVNIIVNDGNGTDLREFKSASEDLMPWRSITLSPYFDTNDLENGDYPVIIEAIYDGGSTRTQGTVTIAENVGAETVEEIPGSFSVGALVTPFNALLVMLAVFLLVNVYLLFFILKGKSNKEEVPIDPAVKTKIKEMRAKYNDDYIRSTLIKKGWPKQKIDRALK